MSAEIFPWVTIDPNICFGKPTIREMRIRVSDVLSMLAAGMNAEGVLADYPYLEPEDITAAIAYAARATGQRLAFAATYSTRFLVDAQLPPALCALHRRSGRSGARGVSQCPSDAVPTRQGSGR